MPPSAPAAPPLKYVVGIDIAKDTFVACFGRIESTQHLRFGKQATFDNSRMVRESKIVACMTFFDFNRLSFRNQKTIALLRGRFLATRWRHKHEAVRLYVMPEGFFVEMTLSADKDRAQYLLAFEARSEDDRLADYAVAVTLPDWMPDTEE